MSKYVHELILASLVVRPMIHKH